MQKIQAKLKHSPQDFIVEEIGDNWHCKISKEFAPNTKGNTEQCNQPPIQIDSSQKDFLWLELEKSEIEHFQTIKEIARQLKINPQDISYAGTKDKIAHTSQRISIFKPNLELLKNFQHEKIILKNPKWNSRKIKIGYLDANHFKIILRDIDKKDAIKVSNQIKKLTSFPNYFGPQRFGVDGKNLITGRLLLKRDFEHAAQLFHPQQEKISNPMAYLKSLPRKILLMHICAIQSKIFNEIVSQALEEGLDLNQKGQQSGILVGYKTRFSKGRLGQIEQQVLKQNDINLSDFRIEEIPHLKVKGTFRRALTPIKDLKLEIEDDEKFQPSKKIILEFALPSGTYATTFLENFFIFT